ncbi:MAG: beta-ketoacyl synthase [Desulfuromonas sp.]|uniref:beta-ketoacyl synthase N-terminal-like domain-containing protein n=1 Tax=Desulfuromonas sp. TaxID=892 RepID=UPI000CC18803|nr:beta-ketoacyl synthase N-terminal-like domain-containing protein [Desulfuromonas sp.]PLX85243.1 MAG: beta-ketoacyl synthase [Desulfuromonas sp.]
MREVCISEARVVTALGDDLAETWNALLAGSSGIVPLTRFAAEGYGSGFAACVPGLERAGEGSLMHPLLDRLLDGIGLLPGGCRLLTASTKGGIDNLERLRRGLPADAADLPLGALPKAVAERLGLAGGVNVSAACASSTIAVARAAAAIASGRAEAVLVCCLDLVSEFVFSGFSALQALDPRPCRPFDRERAGLSLGEGAAALLLTSAPCAAREGRPVLGRVRGWGVAGDAHHITAPARDGCGLVAAVRQSLDRAGLEPDAVAAVCAHGTGTAYNDLMELTAFDTVFGKRPVPLHSVKGALGHTLGAAGGIEIALGLCALNEGAAPPTLGLRRPEELGRGRVHGEPRSFGPGCLLSTNSGFGGVNAAVLLERGGAR